MKAATVISWKSGVFALLALGMAARGHERATEEHDRYLGGEIGKGPAVDGTASMTGGPKDVMGSNDTHLEDIDEFAVAHLNLENSGLDYAQYKAEMQVVEGLRYTLMYNGVDKEGVCKEKRTIVVYEVPWKDKRIIESDTKEGCS